MARGFPQRVKILLLAVLGLFVFELARKQPIEVVHRNRPSTQEEWCKACNGQGFAQNLSKKCASCQGTGKGEWRFAVKNFGRLKSGESKPLCGKCSGRGVLLESVPCPTCQGAGKVKGSNEEITVVAGLSLWERLLVLCGVPPDRNARPYQVALLHWVPVVREYAELKAPNPSAIRLGDWAAIRREKTYWVVRVSLKATTADGKERRQRRDFFILNREVVSTALVAEAVKQE